MSKPWLIALAVGAVLVAGVVAYLSFGRGTPPSTDSIPAAPGAVETKDGAEVNP